VLKAFDDDRARLVFMTVTLTGIRRFELPALRWKHVNLLDATLRVEESKTDEGERLIALSPVLADALAEHYASTAHKADEDFVFGHPERGTQLDHEWYAGEFRKALIAAGITDYVRPFHDARHGALTNLAAAGVSRWRSWASQGTARWRRRGSTFISPVSSSATRPPCSSRGSGSG
jgi:integrase